MFGWFILGFIVGEVFTVLFLALIERENPDDES